MSAKINNFILDQSGAVTVDWVVLTAAIGLMGFLIVSTVATGAIDHAADVGLHLSSVQPGP